MIHGSGGRDDSGAIRGGSILEQTTVDLEKILLVGVMVRGNREVDAEST